MVHYATEYGSQNTDRYGYRTGLPDTREGLRWRPSTSSPLETLHVASGMSVEGVY